MRKQMLTLMLCGMLAPAAWGQTAGDAGSGFAHRPFGAQPATKPAADAAATTQPMPIAEPAATQPKAAATTQPNAPAEKDLLGIAFESTAHGITFRPPAGSTSIRRASGDEIAQFVDEKRGWVLKVGKSVLSQPVALSIWKDQFGKDQNGVLELELDSVTKSTPGAEVLRSEVVEMDIGKVGMIALRYTGGGQRHLTQIAIIQADKVELPPEPGKPKREVGGRLYYIFNLTTPGMRKFDDKGEPIAADVEDPTERTAVETLTQLIDSVKILNMDKIRDDQNNRLFATRALLTQWTNKETVRKAMIPEQWLRLLRDGKDIGYSYVVEREPQKDDKVPPDGVLVGVRSRTIPDTGVQVDAESWMYCRFDFRHESWSNVAIVQDPRGEGGAGGARSKDRNNYMSEFGTSDQRLRSHDLSVTYTVKAGNPPVINRPLPPWYLPAAYNHLLPRLLPLDRPKNYLFASYIGEQREVVARYVEVLPEQDVTFNGDHFRAVPIKDRLTMEGAVTTHYMTIDGKYLGSESVTREEGKSGEVKTTRVTVLPCSRQTLDRLWDKPNLTEPTPREHPAEKNRDEKPDEKDPEFVFPDRTTGR
ncbi:MAG TPA: hypothetical protein VIL86_06490 [Tepidisphaeraceae bacterium]|jgi:hypothetical protein